MFTVHFEVQILCARLHLHLLELQPPVQLQESLYFPREEARAACRPQVLV